MGKYLLFWELSKSRIPVDPKERGGGWQLLMATVKQDMEKGVLKDWGAFTSEGRGYCIVEGSNLEVMQMTEQYVPFVTFKTHPVSSALEVDQLIEHLTT